MQGLAVIRVRNDVAGGVHGIEHRHHGSVGVCVAAEIPIAEVRDWHGNEAAAAVVFRTRTFAGEEKECLVAAVIEFRDDDRATDVGRFHMLPPDGFAAGCRTPKKALCIQLFVAQLEHGRTVECVAAGLGGEIQNAV